MRALGLLQFTDIVVLKADLASEFQRMLSFDPGQIIFADVGRQFLVATVVSVPVKAIARGGVQA